MYCTYIDTTAGLFRDRYTRSNNLKMCRTNCKIVVFFSARVFFVIINYSNSKFFEQKTKQKKDTKFDSIDIGILYT